MSKKKIVVFVLLAAFVVVQFIPSNREEVTVEEANKLVVENAEVASILNKACMDCHSNETTYPWYASIAPISFWIEGHIDHGREELNFSEWNSYPIEDQKHLAKEAAEIVEKKEMPMLFYWLIHWDAKLTPEEREALVNYFNGLK